MTTADGGAERIDTRYRIKRGAFQVEKGLETELVAGEADYAAHVWNLLHDFGGAAEDEDDYLILCEEGDRPRRIGPWLVNTVQVAGSDAGYVLEFITEEPAGDPSSFRAFRLCRTAMDGNTAPAGDEDVFHDRRSAMCLFRCFVERRDLTRFFRLEQVWSAADAAGAD